MAENKPLPEKTGRDRKEQKASSPEGIIYPTREASLLNARTVLLGAAGFVALIVFALLVSAAIFFVSAHLGKPAETGVAGLPTPTLGGPQLQVNAVEDLQNLRATQQANLSQYGWVDQQGGKVHMPIDQAMKLVAQGKLPSAGGAAPAAPGDQAAAGQQVFTLLCSGCHTAQNNSTAPTLQGLFDQPVSLKDGGTVTADEAYLRESILTPDAKIVAGYGSIMPNFSDRLSQQDLEALVAYIKFLEGQ